MDEIDNATIINLQPDDILVIECPRAIGAADAAAIKARVSEYTSRRVLILGESMHLRVLRETD